MRSLGNAEEHRRLTENGDQVAYASASPLLPSCMPPIFATGIPLSLDWHHVVGADDPKTVRMRLRIELIPANLTAPIEASLGGNRRLRIRSSVCPTQRT